MSREKISDLKPILSVLLVIITLFMLVFFKMEMRRVGYSILKKVRVYQKLQDNYRFKSINYARYTSPDNLREMAVTRLTLSEAKFGQIIQMSGRDIAVKQ